MASEQMTNVTSSLATASASTTVTTSTASLTPMTNPTIQTPNISSLFPYHQAPTLTLTNVQHFLSFKLDKDNYRLWRAQIVPYLRGQLLFGYIDGSTPCPPRTQPFGLPDPQVDNWIRQDQIILSALISSLTESILSHVVNETTSSGLWYRLERLYASQSQSRILNIRRELATLSKGADTIDTYVNKVEKLRDHLAQAGQPISDPELVTFLLAGLDTDFDSSVVTITTRAVPMLWDDVVQHLSSFEARLESRNKMLDLGNPSANMSLRETSGTSRQQGGFHIYQIDTK